MNGERYQTLDVFRGGAILLVALYHFTARLPAEALNMPGPAWPQVGFGWIGVYFFFVVSGYCIFLTLERASDARQFLARRVSRLYPAYASAVLVLFVLTLIVYVPSVPEANYRETAIGPLDIVLNLLVLGELGEWVNGSFWSIAVEIKFYLGIALLAALLGHRTRLVSAFFWIAMGASALWACSFLVSVNAGPLSGARFLEFIVIAPYLPFFALGILGRAGHSGLMKVRLPYLLTLLTTLAVLALKMLVEWQNASVSEALGVMVLFGLLAGLFTWFVSGRALPRVPGISAGLARMGVYSYCWYLLHETLGFAVMSAAGPYLAPAVNAALAIVVTFAAAVAFSFAVEWRFRKPVEALVMRLLPGRRPVQEVVPPRPAE